MEILVSLTVSIWHVIKHFFFTCSELKVENNTRLRDQTVELACDSLCSSKDWVYYWKNGNQKYNTLSSKTAVVPNKNAYSYSCSVDQDIKNLSSSVCVTKSGCWDVSYTSTRVCALINSTVDISCTYTHPSDYTVNKTFWHYAQPGVFRDLREERQFAGRVEFVENKLRIKELKISDSGEYKFRIITDKKGGTYSGSPGVLLTVTDTQVISSPDTVSEGKKVILSCSTKCTLSNKHTYIWYKNGQHVTHGFTKDNKLYLDSVSSEELQQFSCAVGDAV
ncbi:uncharacterized protein LOC130215765 [Danio aesculapii]|uniref:uncharacterized protein LOC130215765 n=1 Tax=Danio aesculapii TaxID=1142201 RepID=UPI0024BF4CE4|nr:uncharacterized protein LOC130215765 [Danio aesculapii]